jgi:two-component system, cell cycle sensor histidine kinase and response regulator CckA
MSKSLHLLMAEDSASDALLILEELRRGGYDVISERVQSADAMRTALGRGAWDIVISDFKMPQFDGLEALQLLRESAQDIPFILVTGTVGEEIAVGVMKAGADDYLRKENLRRLVPTVERALREAEQRRQRRHAETQLRQSEAKYRVLVENLPQKVFLKDASLRFVSCNEKFARDMGITVDEVIGKNDYDFYPRELADKYRADDHHVMETGQVGEFDEINTHNGRTAVVRAVKTPVRDEQGKCTGILGIFWDITERHQAEQAVRMSEEKYRALVETTNTGFLTLDARGRVLDANAEYVRMTGHGQLEEILGHSVADWTAPHDLERHAAAWSKCVDQGFLRNLEIDYVNRKGQVIPVEINATVVGKGDSARTLCLCRDISVRKEAQVAWRKSEEQVLLLMASTAEGIFGLDMEGNFTFCNMACLRMLGYAEARDLLGKDMHALIHHSNPDGTPLHEESSGVRIGRRSGEPRHADDQYYWRANGTCFPVEYWFYPVRRGQELIGSVVTFFDITERKRAEEAHARLAMAVEQATETIVITDASGSILYVNPAFEKTTGYSRQEAIGQNPRILKSGKHNAAFYKQMWDTLGRGGVWRGRVINKKKDGTFYEEDATITPVRDTDGAIINYVAIKLDVTREVEMEVQLRQAQKMKAIGTLAGGVAHEINNPINGIINYAQVIADELPPDSTAQEHLAKIKREAARVAQIVRGLLAFARQDSKGRSMANLNDIIDSALSLMQTVIRHDQITLEVDVPEGLPQMQCRSQQLEQVMVNLLTNARDALNEKYSGYHENKKIRVSARLLPKENKPWIRTTIEDLGTGIPTSVRDRIFDPFYTTKPAGQGTGLGLSISYGIVKEHGGDLHFETEKGRYTRFHLDLPVKK